MSRRSRRARVGDVEKIALGLPNARKIDGWVGRPGFQVGNKMFAGFRSARPDAVDVETGERLDDVIMFWTPDEQDKLALVQSPGPWFTTSHFDGYNAILIRASHLDQIGRDELEEVIIDAWRTRATASMVRAWEKTQSR